MSLNDELPAVQLPLSTMLWALKRGEILVPEYGICWHLAQHCRRTSDRLRVKRWMEEWPEYTGSAMYPVPGPHGRRGYAADAEVAYDFSVNKWKGEYGGNRMRLLNYLINRAEGRIHG